jgi:hypothetical protein
LSDIIKLSISLGSHFRRSSSDLIWQWFDGGDCQFKFRLFTFTCRFIFHPLAFAGAFARNIIKGLMILKHQWHRLADTYGAAAVMSPSAAL